MHNPGAVQLPALTNGAALIPVSACTAFFYAGAQGPLLRTSDLGSRWVRVRGTGRFEQVFWLNFTTSRDGAAVVTTRSLLNPASFWRTTDGGETWHSVPIH